MDEEAKNSRHVRHKKHLCPTLTAVEAQATRIADQQAASSSAAISASNTFDPKQSKLASITTPDTHSRADRALVHTASPTLSQSRKRDSSVAGLDASPSHDGDSTLSPSGEHGGGDIDHEGHHSRKRPVKRACNECRQQKVRAHSSSGTSNSKLTASSCDAMWYRTHGRRAADVPDSSCPARSMRTSKE